MPRSATTAFLHMDVGLNIKSIKHLYKECHAFSHTTSRLKADSNVNVALDNKLHRESAWSRKGSIIVYSENCIKRIGKSR